MSSAMVEVLGLEVQFDGVKAVAGVSFVADRGEALALLGRNGAGKSTTMRVLAGVIPATGGTALVDGYDARRQLLAVKRRVGYCPDVGGLVPRATPWEHLQLAARLRRMPRGWEARARSLLESFDLAEVTHRVTAAFSHGMGRRLSVVLATFHEPDVLLLDEPFDGVDPLGTDATLTEIRAVGQRGGTVILSTHLRELAVQACDRAVVLRGGSAVTTTPSADLSGSEGEGRYRDLLEWRHS